MPLYAAIRFSKVRKKLYVIHADKSHNALCDRHYFAFAQLSTFQSSPHIALCDFASL